MELRKRTRINNTFNKSALWPTAVLGIGLAAPVVAQEAGGRPASARPSTVEEIIVTARRREESIQDVPISISVFSQEALSQRNVVTASDLATYTPSLTVNNRFGSDQSSFAIRGFTQELRTTASVGVYFADVVAPRGGGSVTAGDGAGPGAFFDLQNVQVLKGPQGTLFGRNTTGGAVVIVPQKPTYELEGYVELSGGDFDLQRAQGVVNLPLSDTLRLRLGVDHQTREGILRNGSGVGPKDMANVDYTAGRASLVWDVTRSLENYTVLTYTNSKNNGTISGVFACNPNLVNGRRVGLATFCDAQLATQDKDFYAVESPTRDPFNELKQWQAINTTTWQATDHFTVKNILSYSDLDQTTRTSVFGTNFAVPSAAPVIGGIHFPFTNSAQVPGIPTNSQRGFVEELQFQANAFDNKLTWQGGLYYETSKPDGLSGSQSQNQIYCSETPGVDPATFKCQDILRQLAFFGQGGTVPISRINAAGNVQRQLGRVTYENKAVYTQATFNITDAFKVTGGLRYTWDETSGTSQQILYRQFPGLAPGAPGALPFVPATGTPPAAIACVNTKAALPNCLIRLSQKSEAPTGLIGFDYLPTDGILLYTKYTRGYRQGSINIFGAEGFQTHEPEHVDAYEIGAKTRFGGPMPGTFNIAAFYNELTDQQIQAGFQSSTGAASGTTGILNAGSSIIQGVEVESSLMLFEGMSLDISYTYLDTELKKLAAITLPPGGLFDILTPSAVAGGPLAMSPENKLAVTATYRLPLSDSIGAVSLGATWVYTDEQLTSASSAFGVLPSYDLLNLNLNWKGIAGSPVDAAFFMSNVTDEKYPAYVPGLFNGLGLEARVVGEPRMWGVRLRYSFGRDN